MDELPLRIAAWQCRPGPLDVPGNLRRLAGACAVAAARGVDVLVTPEMFTTGYAITAGEVLRLAEDAGGPTETAVAGLARRYQIGVAYGYPERAPGGRAYNAAALVGPDGVVRAVTARCTSTATWTGSSSPPAPSRPPRSTSTKTRAGMLICYDVEFPEAVRHLAADGARTVLVPTANMAGCEQVQDFLVRARACENGVTIAYANYCGADDEFTYNGTSMICGPGGEILAQADTDSEELIVADLPAQSAGTYLADRRARPVPHRRPSDPGAVTPGSRHTRETVASQPGAPFSSWNRVLTRSGWRRRSPSRPGNRTPLPGRPG